MAREDIFIRLQVDTSDGISKTAALAREIDGASKELRQFKVETKEQTQLSREQATQLAALETRLHGLRGAYREAKNDQSGLTDEGLRFRDKIGGTFTEKLNASVASFGTAVVGAFAVDKIVTFTKELANLAATNELLDRRAQVVLGDSLPGISAAAQQNANAIGLTTREYIALAASQQDVFDNLGLARNQTAQFLPKLLELSDGLADFSGGQLDTAQAADILRAAVQGNTKGLAELGIPVKRSKEELSLLADEIQRNQGVTREQAEALAAIELVYKQVGSKVEEFGAGQTTLADKQDEANARYREAKEALADSLAPAFVKVTNAAANYVSVLGKVFDESTGLGDRLANLASLTNVPLAILKGQLNQTQESIDKAFAKAEQRIADFGANADLRGLNDYAQKLREKLSKAIEDGDDISVEKLGALFAPGGAFSKALAQATGPKVSVPINLDIPQEKITVVGDLKQKLKELREEREQLSVTDSEALSKNSAEIAALEAQINKIDGKTKATRELTAAERERAAQQAEAARLMADAGITDTIEPDQTIEPQVPTTGQGLDPAASLASGADPQAILAAKGELNAQIALLDEEYRAGEIASFGAYLAQKALLEQQAADKSIAEEERVKAVRQAATQQALGQAANLFNSLAGMAEENSEEQKALATIAALINTYQGATAALSAPDVLPQPAALIVKLLSVAAVVASGLASVKKIQGFASSGIVKSSDGPRYTNNPGDTVLVSAYPGEMYLNDKHQDAIRKRAGYDIFSAVGVPGAGSVNKSVGGLRGALGKISRHLGPIRTGIPGFASSGVVPSINSAQLSQINVAGAIRDINFQPVVTVEAIDRGQADQVQVMQLATL